MHTHGIHGGSSIPFLPLVPRGSQAKEEFVLEPFPGQIDPDGSRGQSDPEPKRQSEEEPEKLEKQEAATSFDLPPPSTTPLTVYNRSGMLQSRPIAGGQIRTSG